jgi:Ni,Fe-hydrogenase III large subunit
MENIAGDTAIGHSTAYCTVVERLAGVEPTDRAHILRRVALELERLANHTRDLGALGGDTGFLPTSSWNGRITGDWLNITSELCGSRMGRNLLCPGGVKWDVDAELARALVKRVQSSYRDTRGSVDVMLETPSVLARLEGTGTVSRQAASDLGLVGMAARASGVAMDCRFDWPLCGIENPALTMRVPGSGDVKARTLVRSQEVDDSAASAAADLEFLGKTSGSEPVRVSMPEKLPAGRLAVALVEGWRGEICHVGITDADGGWQAYKVVDPSFHNWTGLAMALRGEQISDFPLCNKSFNLSYCGHDL